VGNGAAFDANKPVTFKDVTDGTSNTIMVIEVAEETAVIWTKPDDWQFDPNNPTQGLGRFYDEGFNATFCDGSVHFLMPTEETADRLRKLFTRAGGEVVSAH
jgi:prepilin-type processing-associated H-X9-DG protein